MTITQRVTQTASGKSIAVIDGLFNFSELAGIHTGIVSLPYKISNSNAAEVQDITDRRLVSYIDQSVLNRMGFNDPARASVLKHYIPEDYVLFNSYVNLGIRGDQHQAHSDYYWSNGGKTLLLYANKEWHRDWCGETFFYNDAGTEIEYVNSFVPGRVVIFDSDIPHLAREQSNLGPSYRFTLAVKYVRKDKLPPR